MLHLQRLNVIMSILAVDEEGYYLNHNFQAGGEKEQIVLSSLYLISSTARLFIQGEKEKEKEKEKEPIEYYLFTFT